MPDLPILGLAALGVALAVGFAVHVRSFLKLLRDSDPRQADEAS